MEHQAVFFFSTEFFTTKHLIWRSWQIILCDIWHERWVCGGGPYSWLF